MPKLNHSYPKYRCKRRKLKDGVRLVAVVTIHGVDHYLGPHGSKASHDEYDRLIGEYIASGSPCQKNGKIKA